MQSTATSWVLTPDTPTPTPITHPKSKHPWDAAAKNQKPPYRETIVLHRTKDETLTLTFAEAPETHDEPFAPFDAQKIIYGAAVLATHRGQSDTFVDTPEHAFAIAAQALNDREEKENQAKAALLAMLARH
jgi:hypothetical protein